MKNHLKQFFAVLIALCSLAYVILQISLTVGDMIEVENVVYAETRRTLPLTALIFRDETTYKAETSGKICSFYSDGEKVAKGKRLLAVYPDSKDAETQQRINDLNAKISVLERSTVIKSYTTSDFNALDSSIKEHIGTIIQSVAEGKLDMASLSEEELLVLMNRRSSSLTAAGGYDMLIDNYKKEINDLQQKLSGSHTSIYSSKAGYFYGSTDGYENTFTMNKLQSLTIDEYAELEAALPDEEAMNSSVCKIVTSSTWYITVKLDKITAARLTEGNDRYHDYSVIFPYSDGKTVKMKLEKMISQTDYDSSVLVLSSDLLADGFNYTRSQPVELVINEYAGLKVPESAIRFVDGKTGVYTLDGTVVKFKTTEVMYKEKGYCYCRLPDEKNVDAQSADELSLYDPIVVSGKDIYEGKIVN